jgi:hypothetical protein
VTQISVLDLGDGALPDDVRRELLDATELHERCCKQEHLQEVVHQGLRYVVMKPLHCSLCMVPDLFAQLPAHPFRAQSPRVPFSHQRSANLYVGCLLCRMVAG